MKSVKLALLATLFATAPTVAFAQDAGVMVYSQVDDSEVGTIASNDGTNAVLDTGSYQVPLGTGSFAMREGKWTINATKAQIDSMMAAAEAEAAQKLAAALVDGASVISADQMPVGTVLAMDEAGDQIIVESEAGIVSLKREHFAVSQTGALTALFTAEQLAGFTTAVPEGAVVETPEGQMMRTADGWEATGADTASASSAGATGVSQ